MFTFSKSYCDLLTYCAFELKSKQSPYSFPGGASGKEPACQCRRRKRGGVHPWDWKVPWRGAWQPTPVFLHENPHGQRRLVGCNPRGHKESDRAKAT